MKLLCTLFALGLAALPAGASDASDVEQRRAGEIGKDYPVYEASDGQVYRDVTVTRITDAGISIRHAEGTARLGFERLSAEQREQFGITREGAEARIARERKAQAAYEAHLAAKQKEWQEQRQKAHQELLARQEAARVEAEHVQAERPQAPPVSEPQDTTSIVSALEVPRFPIIRGSDNQILRPMQGHTRSYRSRHYGSSGNGYPVYYGGSYGYPSCGTGYHPGYHRGSWGWLSYRKGNFTITTKW